jgi:serine phosphatase RsbU (regulator of sigma subunit)
MIKHYIPECFIYFRPKDIVSGDFYWFYEHNNRLFIAVADCTGHGVPGAFMSMIGSTLLNEIVIDKEESIPSEILEKLNTGVIKALNQNIENSGDFTQTQDDGMDISLCCIDLNTQRIEIACANHGAYIIDGDRIELVQGELYSIGGMFTNNVARKYTNYSCPLKKGMQVYMFSDGYQDQFGGPKNKKFLASKFKELLYSNKNIKMSEHVDILDTTFETWKGRNKQIDDVLVLGITL